MTGQQKGRPYSPIELMAICGARAIKDGETVFAGTGLPMLSAALAQRTHAPRSKIIYEGGFIDTRNRDLAISVADSRLHYRAAAAIGLIETLGMLLQGGRIDVGFLGAAQIDKYGNINTTYIGDFSQPKVRLPGAGGGNDIATSAKRVVVIMTHHKRKFVKDLDYVTSPGHLKGADTRREAGIRGGGPSLVVTDLCQMDFAESSKEMRLMTVHSGISVQEIVEETPLELIIPGEVTTTPEPTPQELRTLRELDPTGLYLGKASE